VPLHPSEGRPAGPICEACLWAITNLAAGSKKNEDRLGNKGDFMAVQLVNITNKSNCVDVYHPNSNSEPSNSSPSPTPDPN
jgi:hypothetical protein